MTFLRFLEGVRTPFLDELMQLVTYFGQEILLIAVICTFYWCVDKRFAYLLGFTYFTAGLGVQALKITFRIPRPWILDSDFHAVESALPGATGYSFPSGHTQAATCLFFPLALKSRRMWAKFLCAGAFMLIGFSRMYLGCHTPKDVLVSMGLSVLVSCIIWHFRNFLCEDKAHLTLTASILALLSIGTALYALLLNGSGVIETKYAVDCCKAAGAGLGFAIGWYLERRYLDFQIGDGGIGKHAVKLAAGLSTAFLLKKGAPLLLGSSILAKAAEYCILVLWVLVIYPYLFQKIQRRAV